MIRDLKAALRARSRVLSIATDPDMGDDVKLFAFCLQAYIIGRDSPPGWGTRYWADIVGELMCSADSLALRAYGADGVCRRAMAKDVPRYEIPAADEVLCRSLKARGPQAGEPCGKTAVGSRLPDRHPITGEGAWVGYCRNHSHPVLDEERRERLTAWHANGRPSPPANTGGALRRHFSGDWDHWYRWASAWRPGIRGEHNEVMLPPNFTLLEGEGNPLDLQPEIRARLSIVPSPEVDG